MSQAGIYLHIPFCRSRCSYCDFATDVYKNAETVERYVRALVKEIADFPHAKIQADTIYFGGGTPSLLSPAQLEKILDAARTKFSISRNAEVTIEMNPATVTFEALNEYKNLGVNRASFGAQTFDDTELKRLGRRHSAQDVRETIKLLRRANYENISFDLIAGLPRQTIKDWKKNLDEALKLQPEHLSLYLLEIHEGTPLAAQIRAKRQPLPDEDLAAEMYEIMIDKVSAKGYSQYEISNFSLPNFESKHNSKYWLCEPVYAFGVSAHSFDGKFRRANERDTNRYVSLIERGESPVAEINDLSPDELAAEFAFLNLRLAEGLDLAKYKRLFGVDLQSKFEDDFKRLIENKLIQFDNNKLKLTQRGMIYSNEVFSIFV